MPEEQSADQKKLLLFGGIGVVILFVTLLILVFLTQSQNTSPEQVQNQEKKSLFSIFKNRNSTSNTQNSISTTPAAQVEAPPPENPLIEDSDLQEYKQNFNKRLKKEAIPTPQEENYNFQYQLSPELQKKGTFNLFSSAYAEDVCDEVSTTSTIPVYKLKRNYKAEEAKKNAAQFDVVSDPYSAETNTGALQYVFTDPTKSGDYFSQYKSSGSYHYHKAMATVGEPITITTATEKKDYLLGTVPLLKGLEEIDAQESLESETGTFIFTFQKKWDLPIFDRGSITEIKDRKSVCSLPQARSVNTLQLLLARDGIVSNVISSLRNDEGKISLPSQSLTDALIDTKSTPLIPPEVVSNSDVKSGTVTINESKVVYYDLGFDLPQCLYAPMYLVSGTTKDGSTVAALFPAVPISELEKNCPDLDKDGASVDIPVKKIDGSESTIQYGSFKFSPTEPPKPPGGTGKCWGNQVDYTVTCSNSKSITCSIFLGVKLSDEHNDPLNTCTDGCVNPIKKSFTITQGEDACKKMLDAINSDLKKDDKDTFPTDDYKTPPNLPDGSVNCTFNACPC